MSDPDVGNPEFLDSNVLIYAFDPSDSRKQAIGRDLLRRGVIGQFAISTQVMGEFVSTLIHKLIPAPSEREILQALDSLSPLRLVLPDSKLVRRAVEAHVRYGIHFYDGMIVAAAERADCRTIWSEDFNPGQTYFGITIRNPFD
jgi:predicted nucleic acid-binding protein